MNKKIGKLFTLYIAYILSIFSFATRSAFTAHLPVVAHALY